MKVRAPFLFVLLLWFSTLHAQTADRFSQTLTTTLRDEIKFDRLSSDQVGVLDALVRRDIAGRSARAADAPGSFSERLTPDQRRNAGLALLTASEVARLDALIDRYGVSGSARTLLAPPVYIARTKAVQPREEKAERKIHGSFSLSMGWGSDGYSERTGAMTLRMDDPAGRYSISVGYAESHIKGGSGYYSNDSFYGRPDALDSPP